MAVVRYVYRFGQILIEGEHTTFRFAHAGILTGTTPLTNLERLRAWKMKKELLRGSHDHR